MSAACRTAPAVWKAQTDDKELSVRAVLSDGTRDQAGELVHLDGLDFAEHAADPWVDVEHTGRLVGWARKSLSRPGEYEVAPRVRLNFGDAAAPDWREVPVGKSYFDPKDRLQSQTFGLVRDDVLPGVSLEFRPVVRKSAGWSELENRPAYDYPQASVVRWTHCKRPVCEAALTVTKALRERYEAADAALAKVLRDKLVYTPAGWEHLHPALYKAISGGTSAPNKVTVPVRVKAMNDDTDVYTEAVDDGAAEPAEPDGDEAPALGGVAAHYRLSEGLLDLKAEFEELMQSSDSPELRKKAEKMAAWLDEMAEEAKGVGDAHDAKLNGGKADEPEGDAEPEDEPEPDMDRDDEGTLKAVRPPYRRVLKAMRAKRFKSAEVEKAIAEADIESLRAELEKTRAAVEAEAKLARRARRIYV